MSIGREFYLVFLALFLFSQYSNAQIVSRLPQNGLYIGGNVRFSPADGFTFGRWGGSVSNVYNFNTALKNAPEGYSAHSINYGWEYQVPNADYSLRADVTITGGDGEVVYSRSIEYGTTGSFVKEDYSYELSGQGQVSGLKVSFSSSAGAVGNGWSGPTVREVYADMVYERNTCIADPTSDVKCSGYASAVMDRLCSINPQSSPNCANYRVEIPLEVRSAVSADTWQEIQPYTVEPSKALTQTNETTSPSQSNTGQLTASNASNQRTANRPRPPVNAQKNQAPDPQEQAMQDIQQGGPSMDAYTNARLVDVPFYAPKEIYKNIVISDNVRAQRQLTQRSNISHGRMVDGQYRR